MAKIIVTKNTYGIKFPNQKDNLLKIMNSNYEPPKDYLWETEDGYLYVYYNNQWIYIKKYIAIVKWVNKVTNHVNISESDLNEIKATLLDKLSKYIKRNGSIPEWFEERLEALETKEDKDTIYDDSYIRELIRQLDEENDDFLTASD